MATRSGSSPTALDRVQHTALDLAVGQAVLKHQISEGLVDLARRTQRLVGLQLDEIAELEATETDPAMLERLFKLDHLATRIRRSSESLIVLAGVETTRTWRQPVPVSQVVRSALGEVEDYQRVEFGPIDTVDVRGSAVADLGHLLAELVENGLNFSPPHSNVGIFGRLDASCYKIGIVDAGIGMSSEELALANDRLAGVEQPGVAPSRYLGHFVSARLAQRIGASVRLDRAPTGGVHAEISLPLSIVGIPDRAGSERRTEPAPAGTPAPAPQVVPPPAATPTPAPAPAVSEVDPAPAEPVVHGTVAHRTVAHEAPPAHPETPTVAPPPHEDHELVAAPSVQHSTVIAEPVQTTPSGLPRRVRGANLPAAGGRFDEVHVGEDALVDRTADGVRSMLDRFSTGVAQARSESADGTEYHPEENR